MSLEHKKQIKCEECGKAFDVSVFESINVSINPELKEKVINGEIYCFECPHCHHVHHISYPFLYHDMEHKFMINQGTPGELMNYYEEMKDNKVSKDFPGLMENYINIGVTSYRNLLSKIAILEKGLDYRVATVCQLILKMQVSKYADEKKQEKVVDAFYIVEDDKLTLLVQMQSLEDEEKGRFIPLELKEDFYNEIKENHFDRLKDSYPFFFDEDQALKYMTTNFDKIDEMKQDFYEIVLAYTSNGRYYVTFVPKFNEGKFKENDVVIVMKDMDLAKMRIKKVLKMNAFEMPLVLDNMPVVVRAVEGMSLTTSGNSNDELDNKALKEMFAKFQKDKDLDEELILKSNVIAVLEVVSKMDPEEMSNLKVGDTIDGTMVKMDFKTIYDQGRPLFAVYLEQGDIKDEYASKTIYNFDTLITVVLNSPNHFNGIIVNPDTDKIVLNMADLLEYKCGKVFGHAGRMRKLLLSLSEKEIDYLGKGLYELVCKLYFEDKGMDSLSNDTGKTEEELKKSFGRARWLLSHIIWDNY